MSINLTDLSNSPYLASDDYTVGTVLPIATVAAIKMEDVPVPNSTKKNRKAIMYFAGAKKAWCINKTEARKIAAVIGETKNIDAAWIGAKVQLCVVGDVRRPDGTKGNAFRIKQVIAPDRTVATSTTTTTIIQENPPQTTDNTAGNP
jgi:hypothetical protein